MSMPPREKWHPAITEERIMAAVERRHEGLEDPGFCLSCGEEAEGVEPDARGYKCEACGEPSVYGDEDLLIMLA